MRGRGTRRHGDLVDRGVEVEMRVRGPPTRAASDGRDGATQAVGRRATSAVTRRAPTADPEEPARQRVRGRKMRAFSGVLGRGLTLCERFHIIPLVVPGPTSAVATLTAPCSRVPSEQRKIMALRTHLPLIALPEYRGRERATISDEAPITLAWPVITIPFSFPPTIPAR